MHFGKLKKRARNILIFFVFSTILLVGLSWAVFNILSASQSFISYHSLWTQSQQRAIIHLISYMNTENEQEYIYFRESVGIMKNIQEALYELNMDEPDIEAVEAHLSLDIVDQDEINNVIRLFSLLRKFEKYQKIFNKWENFHQQVELFDELGEYVYREVQSGDRNLSINELLNLAEGLNIILTEEQVLLLSEFRSISVFIKKASLSIIILISSSLLVIGFFLSRNWINGFEKLQKVNEEKDELAKFPSLNPNPVVEISGNGRLNYLNHSAQKRFPELGKKGMAHSYLYSPEFMFDPAMYKNYKSRIREVTIGDTIYEQIIYYLPEVNKFHIYGYDITKRKESQNNLKKALEEKEVLLAEIHHRVKNNLAIIAGLLELESGNTDNPETRRVMQSSVSRVLSMASVHEQLYANKSFSEIPFLDYVKELAVKLQQTLSSENDAQTIEVSGDEVILNVNQAIPCGILISELVNNSFKHALTNNRKVGENRIWIKVKIKDEIISVSVSDNGAGLPSGFIVSDQRSLGYTLIQSLAEQLEAVLEVENKGGTTVTYSFKKAEIKGSASTFIVSEKKTDHEFNK